MNISHGKYGMELIIWNGINNKWENTLNLNIRGKTFKFVSPIKESF